MPNNIIISSNSLLITFSQVYVNNKVNEYQPQSKIVDANLCNNKKPIIVGGKDIQILKPSKLEMSSNIRGTYIRYFSIYHIYPDNYKNDSHSDKGEMPNFEDFNLEIIRYRCMNISLFLNKVKEKEIGVFESPAIEHCLFIFHDLNFSEVVNKFKQIVDIKVSSGSTYNRHLISKGMSRLLSYA